MIRRGSLGRRKVAPQADLPPPLTWKERLLAFLRWDPLVNGLLATGIVVGFVHGWLKIRFPSPVTTFLFDLFLIAALMVVVMRAPRGDSFFPRGSVGSAIKLFLLVQAFYVLVPMGPPLIIKAAGMRGWSFAMLMFCMGYKITRDQAQVKSYYYVLIALGVLTAFYGMQQNPAEIEKMMQQDENFAARYQFTYYANTGGGRTLRVFSTFISSGAFGGTMAYVVMFAIVLFTEKTVGKTERLLLIGASLPVAYGMILSGSRSSLVTLGMGFLLIAWHRKNLVSFVVFPAVVVLVLKLASDFTSGAAMDRFSSLSSLDDVIARNTIPTRIGWEYMLENPFGGGLGRSGYSVPFFLFKMMPIETYTADGDLGRLLIEMGAVGVLFFGNILWAAGQLIYRSLTQLRGTSVDAVALASGACFLMGVGSLPSGSPFIGIPMGALTWFFLGTLQKLADEYRQNSAKPMGPRTPAPDLSAPTKPKKHFLHYHPK